MNAQITRSAGTRIDIMDKETPNKIIPYYTLMDNIMTRLKELAKLDYPHKRTYRAPGGNWITEDVPEYLEKQSLIARWYELQDYERALDTGYCRNHLLVSLRLEFITGKKYDPTVAARIADSVYKNKVINY